MGWAQGAHSGESILNKEKTTKLLQKYDAIINDSIPGGVEARDHSGTIAMFGFQADTPQLLEHGRWMCQKACDFDNTVRANRWLGFIQCILLVYRVRGLGGLRDDTRPVREDDVKADSEADAKPIVENSDIESEAEAQPAAPETQPADPEKDAEGEGEGESTEEGSDRGDEVLTGESEVESEVDDED